MVDFHALFEPQFNYVEALGFAIFNAWFLRAALQRQKRILNGNPRTKDEALECIEHHTKKLGK